jgi:hypothetical protein
VKPILDTIGGKLADLLSSISPKDFGLISAYAGLFGERLSGLIGDLLGFKLEGKDATNVIIQGFKDMTQWVNENGPKIKDFFKGVGTTIRDSIIPFIRDELIPAFKKISDWATANGPKIKDAFAGIGRVIKDDIIPWIEDHLVAAFDKIKAWTDENGALIKEFFSTLGEIAGGVFQDLDIGGLDSFLEGIKAGMQWVIDHKEDLQNWITKFIEFSIWVEKLSFVFQILGAIVGIIIGPFLILGGIILGLVAIIAAVAAVISVLFIPQVLIALLILAGFLILYEIAKNFEYLKQVITDFVDTTVSSLSSFVEAGIARLQEFVEKARTEFEAFKTGAAENFEQFKILALQKFEAFKAGVIAKIEEVKTNIIDNITRAKEAILNLPWWEAGSDIVSGIVAGISANGFKIVDILRKMANRALDAIRHALQMGSPSKKFEVVGKMTVLGFVEGIDKTAKMAEQAMQNVAARVSAPALNMPNIMQQYAVAASPSVNTSYQTTNNWNLTVNSQARQEQVIQDYNMMQSLGGA